MPNLQSFLKLAPIAAIVVGWNVAERNAYGEITEAGSLDAFQLQVGDCYNDQSTYETEVTRVPGVPCYEPHDNEVYATFDLSMSEYPGEDRVWELAEEGCLERFEPFVGKAYEDSTLDFMTLVPSEGSWKERDDREVICAVYHMELERLTGSVRNSAM
jgi:hypothetical protein